MFIGCTVMRTVIGHFTEKEQLPHLFSIHDLRKFITNSSHHEKNCSIFVTFSLRLKNDRLSLFPSPHPPPPPIYESYSTFPFFGHTSLLPANHGKTGRFIKTYPREKKTTSGRPKYTDSIFFNSVWESEILCLYSSRGKLKESVHLSFHDCVGLN